MAWIVAALLAWGEDELGAGLYLGGFALLVVLLSALLGAAAVPVLYLFARDAFGRTVAGGPKGLREGQTIDEAMLAEGKHFPRMDGQHVFKHAVVRFPHTPGACNNGAVALLQGGAS